MLGELQRQAYLEAMGVDSYTSRLLLPGALPSPICELPAELVAAATAELVTESDSSAAKDPEQTAATVASVAGASVSALFDEQPAKSGVTKPDVKAMVSELAKDHGAKSAAPAFSLSIVRGQGLMVIDDGLTGQVNPSDYVQLLQNILFAVGFGKQQLSIDAFIWPMHKNSQIDQSATAARQTLAAFLAKQVEQAGVGHVLLMGETAGNYLSEQPLTTGELMKHPQLGVPMLLTQSAVAMLFDSGLKATAWRELQALRQSVMANTGESE